MTSEPDLFAVVLAAGQSRRLGQPKQLVSFRGQRLIERAVSRAAGAVGWAQVCVVLGAHADSMRPWLDPRIGQIVHNADWADGMGSSIREGVAAIARQAGAAMIMLVDQPLVDLQPLLSTWNDDGAGRIVATRYAGGNTGVPAIFPAAYFSALRGLDGETGARDLLREHRDAVCPVLLAGADIDVDLPADLLRLQGLQQHKDTP